VVAADGALRRLSVDEPSLDAIYTGFFRKQAAGSGEARHAA
jgi:ABC-2 type transport system ATP-binding protein